MQKIRIMICATGDSTTKELIRGIVRAKVPGIKTSSHVDDKTSFVYFSAAIHDDTVAGLQAWRDKYEEKILDALKAHNIKDYPAKRWGRTYPFYRVSLDDKAIIENS